MWELGVPSARLSKTTSTRYRPPAFMHAGASRTAALGQRAYRQETEAYAGVM